ncbi:uncharacterized protein F4807DRAFT_18510 [Annulohypoxylon truncatum]|uniref:uncharacterized protein n=1 Tax=Annulohypoxylon truncatum TaxID=327061 RepID=UPI0020072B4E|nr:uncharacterized protein F4807DRAFT_18510 [Annulohypoxylon truncatum]KAI1215039.1 hypothetical protein F4807DRAFT_18510 [Annulohypoxylon truncatum]
MSSEDFYAEYEPYGEEDEIPKEPKTPGEELMWFGKFEGTPLDQLDDNYRWTIYRLSREKPNTLLQGFRDLHDQYTAWLDEKYSPLSTKVWFGQHRGHELRVIYNSPRRWNWLVHNTVWGPELAGIEERYLSWKARQQPRRRPVARARPVIENPVGSRLGPADDRVASDNDEPYDSDGGFVVSDDEMEDSDWDEDEWKDDEDDEDVEYFMDGEESDTETATLHDEEMAEAPSIHDVDSDSTGSLPSLDEIVRRSATKKTPPQHKKRYQPYANSSPIKSRATRQRYIISSDDDDDDEDDDMPIFTPSKSTGKIRRTFDFLAESERTPKNSASHVAARRVDQQESPSRAPKNSQSTVIILSSDSEPERRCSSRANCGHELPVRTANAVPLDSDDEPLVPKLRREMMAKALAKTRR